MKKVHQMICSCDECNLILGDNLQQIKEDKIHYISTKLTKSGLPYYVLCKDCASKDNSYTKIMRDQGD